MIPRTTAICCLVFFLLTSTSSGIDKTGAHLVKISDVPAVDIHVAPTLASADTCVVSSIEVIFYRIDGWVTGLELYKVLLDPAEDCDNPYPYTITEINMPMIFDAGTQLIVSVDVEAVDSTSVPGCPIPGDLLAISLEYDLTVPSEGGLYNIWIPLDTPIVVNGPFFAGFYIGNAIDPYVNAAVLTDTIPIPCAAFNVWDETIGWVDLSNNTYYSFPGHLAMQAMGFAGGNDDSTVAPAIKLISPTGGDILYGSTEVWVWDTTGSPIIDYVSFEYSSGDSYTEISRDYDGTSPLRDGVNPAESGTGFSYRWDFSILPEGSYIIRATAYDTLGRSSSTSAVVYLEPTPPIPKIVVPSNGSDICSPVDVSMSCSDENLSYIEVYHRQALSFFSIGLSPMNQFTVGDNNGNPGDGNLAANGEFGDYYCAPVAAAMAVQVWYNRGVASVMMQGPTALTVEDLSEELASAFQTRESNGTFDEDILCGLKSYYSVHSNELEFDYLRDPSYFDLRVWVEDEERTVMLGLSGQPGLWLTVDGFTGWIQPDSSFSITIANPLTGSMEIVSWRYQGGYSEINVAGTWRRVDIMVSWLAKDWTVNRSLIGADFNSSNGWSITWTPNDQADGNLCFLRSSARDATLYRGSSATLVQYDCSMIFAPGDYNNDSVADIGDLFALIDFITMDGVPPAGGSERADANCDNVVNIADIVYYMNYLFGTASPPCR